MFYDICKALVWLYFHTVFRVRVKGVENIPDDGALICPNHYTLYDPLLVAVSTPGRVRFMAKHEIFKNPVLNFLLRSWGTYPVKRGEVDLNSIKTTLKLLKDKQLVGLFPEGTRIKTGKLGKANPGVALFSIKSGKKVVPVAITGSYKIFSILTIRFGQPIDFSEYKKEKMTNDDYTEISQIVMGKIDELKKEEN